MSNYVIDYDHSPNLSLDQRLQSLRDNIQLALNNISASSLADGCIVDGSRVRITRVDGSSVRGILDGNLVIFKNISADNIVTGTLDAERINVINLDADNIVTGQLAADLIDVETLQTDHLDAVYADVKLLHTDVADVAVLLNRVGLIDTAVISEGHITGHLDAVEINANKITGGTLDVNRLIITDDITGEKYLISFDSEGQAVREKLAGNIIQPRSITTDRLVAHAITANEITTENIIGSSGWINLASATFRYGNEGGNGISWDGQHLNVSADSIVLGGRSVTQRFEALEAVIDNTIETWFGDGAPTLDPLDYPCSEWISRGETYDEHMGDMYYDNISGYGYRFVEDAVTTYAWKQMSDAAATEALRLVRELGNTALTIVPAGEKRWTQAQIDTYCVVGYNGGGSWTMTDTTAEADLKKNCIAMFAVTNTTKNTTGRLLVSVKSDVDTTTHTFTGNVLAYDASITGIQADLAAKASTTYVSQEISRVENSITTVAGRVTTVEGTISTHESRISETEDELLLKVSQSDFDTLENRVDEAETTIEQHAAEIALKASLSDVTALGSRVTQAELDIDANTAAIALKASITDVTNLANRVGEAEIAIDANTAAIALKASQAVVDGLSSRLGQAEIAIDANTAAIALKAAQTDLDEAEGRIDAAEGQITILSGQIQSKASQASLDQLSGTVSELSTTVTQTASGLTVEVTRASNAEAALAAAAAADATAKASQALADAKVYVQAQSFLTVNSEYIQSMVADIAGNATAITQKADQITVDGLVTFKNRADAGSATVIHGSAIKTGTITATQIAANAITSDKIAARTITASDIATATITANEIAANTITAAEIAANAVNTSELAAGAVTAAKIAAYTITASEIASGAITATKIASYSITADKLNVSNLSAIAATIGNWYIGTYSLYNARTSLWSYSWGAYLGTDGIAYAGSLNDCYTVIDDSGIEVGRGVGAYSEYGSRYIYIDPIYVWMNRGSYGCGFEVTSGGNMWTYVAIDYFGSSAEDNLGSSSYRWGTLYNKKNNTSSDMRLKYNIEDLDDRYLDLFDLLRPVCYSTDPDKGSDVSKISVGFIAQEVEEALYDCDLDSTMMSIVDDGEHISDPDYAEPYYSLSYNEFIAILVHKVKQLESRIAEMEAVNG